MFDIAATVDLIMIGEVSVRIVGAEAVISTIDNCIDRKDDDPVQLRMDDI
jgi:hypothetical protein